MDLELYWYGAWAILIAIAPRLGKYAMQLFTLLSIAQSFLKVKLEVYDSLHPKESVIFPDSLNIAKKELRLHPECIRERLRSVREKPVAHLELTPLAPVQVTQAPTAPDPPDPDRYPH